MEIFGIDLGNLAGQSTVLGAFCYGLGMFSKSALDWATGKRKQYLDQLQVALNQQKEDRDAFEARSARQDEKIGILQGQIHNMNKEMSEQKIKLVRVIDYVDILEQQITQAGLTPITPAWKKEDVAKMGSQ